MRAAALMPLVLAAGCTCGPDRLQPSPGGLAFEPADVTFLESNGTVLLKSTVPRALEVRLTVSAPFTVSPETVSLPPHGEAALALAVQTPEGGRFAATLTARAEALAATAALKATVPCPGVPQCQRLEIDAATGHCVPLPAAEGAPCEDACLTNAHCGASGTCLGDAKSCADADACTVDACAPGTGCVHLACDAVGDPCRAGVCTAAGCVFSEVPDGTACGAADCVEAQVCLAGKCAVRAVPEGAACQTPCGLGECQLQSCVLPPGTTLAAQWTMGVGPAASVVSPIAADANGNLYWVEARAANDAVVSVTANGLARWTASLGAEERNFSARALLVDDAHRLVVVSDPRGRLHAWALADGALAWTRSVVNDLLVAPDVAPGDLGYLGTVASGSLLVANVFTYAASGGSPKKQRLFGLDPQTGKTKWSSSQTAFANLVMDEASTTYLRVPGMSGWRVVAIDSGGVQRWLSALGAASDVQAVFDGRVYLAHGEGLTAAGGAIAFQSPYVPDDALTFGELRYLEGDWLASKQVAYLSVGMYAAPRAVDPQTGALRWIRKASHYRPADGLLTARGLRLLLDQRHLGPTLGWQWHLSALTPAGREAWACRLPNYGWWDVEGVSLDAERLVVAGHGVNPVPAPYPAHTGVAAFALPGEKLAPGWSVTSAGSGARTHRPQR